MELHVRVLADSDAVAHVNGEVSLAEVRDLDSKEDNQGRIIARRIIDGEATFPSVEPGRHELTCTLAGGTQLTPQDVEVVSEATKRVDLRLTRK